MFSTRFPSQAPSFPQYIKTPPSFQLLAWTWQRNRSQAEQAAPRLLSAIQPPPTFLFFLKTHNKHWLRELALILVSAEMMEIYFTHRCAGLAVRPIQRMQLSRCRAPHETCPCVWYNTHSTKALKKRIMQISTSVAGGEDVPETHL